MQRPAALAVALTLASFPFLLPHVVEDFQWRIAERAWLPADVAAALLGAGLAVQLAGVVTAAQGQRAGLVVIALAGGAWTLGALWEHGIGLLVFGFGFRGHSLSAVWATGLIVTQALAAGCAAVAVLRSSHRG
jgi:hypothetical protein